MSEYWKQAEGWFNYVDYYKKISEFLKDGDTAVEVGIYKGKSILYLAEALKDQGKNVKLYGVDNFIGESDVQETTDKLREDYYRNIRPLKDYIITLEHPSLEAVKAFPNGKIDFIYIDAAHDYDNVIADIYAWMPKVRKGGIMAGHDYNHPPVKKAVDEVFVEVNTYKGNVWEAYL